MEHLSGSVMEVLIVLSEAGKVPALEQFARPLQWGSHRVFVARVLEENIEQIRALAGVEWVGACFDNVDRLALDAGERLFVLGWQSRQTSTKSRPGDGLDWDTAPRLPPDPPTE